MVKLKPARFVSKAILWAFGMAAVYTPWRTIYILPHLIDDVELIAHEMAHAAQEARDGKWYFWTRIVWWFIRYGHKDSPYEIEANQMARGQSECR